MQKLVHNWMDPGEEMLVNLDGWCILKCTWQRKILMVHACHGGAEIGDQDKSCWKCRKPIPAKIKFLQLMVCDDK